MKKLVVAPMVLVGFSALIVSCASITSTKYVDANIRIATNPRVVSSMQFVDGWSTQAGTAYSAQSVGVMIANDMAGKGWHDITVLVELTSRANPNSYDLNIWQVSIFRTQAPKETAVPQRNHTDFFDLVATGTPNQVMEAIKAGADVTAHFKGWTPLMFAAENNQNPEVVSLLVAAGADINARAEDGATPLMLAASFNQNPEVITALVKAGADLNARESHGATPLMYAAAKNQNPEVIKALLTAGADLSARDKTFGSTPLMFAAGNNPNPEVITVLLKAGADGKAKDNRGLTAFDYVGSNAKLKGTDAYQQLEEASQ